MGRKENAMNQQEIRDPEIREALEMLEECRKGGLHGTPVGRLWSAVTGTLLVLVGLSMILA